MEKGEKQFDLVFMDMHMPVMDGLEAAAKILELNTGVPVVAMTANIMTDDREVYRTSGMVGYVGKPFTSQELWRCLMKFFTPVDWSAEDKARTASEDDGLRYKLINNFLRHNSDIFSEITSALDAGDIKMAHRLAHTLKGNAGQLDKTSLLQAAGDVEERLKGGKYLVTPMQLDRLNTELKATIAEFEMLISESARQAANTSEKPLDAAMILMLLDELEPLLKESDSECMELIDRLRLVPGSDRLIQQIEEFDFKGAIESLAEIKSGLGI